MVSAPPILFLGWRGFEKLKYIDYGPAGGYANAVFSFMEKIFVPAHPIFLPLCFAAFMAGVLMPDLDSQKSKARKWLDTNLDEVEHRTWLHTAYAVCFIAMLGLFPQFLFWTALGYFVHLLCDSFSKCGVAWFRPVKGYRHFGKKPGPKIKKGWHVVLYKNDTQAWVLCSVLCCGALFAGYMDRNALLLFAKELFPFL